MDYCICLAENRTKVLELTHHLGLTLVMEHFTTKSFRLTQNQIIFLAWRKRTIMFNIYLDYFLYEDFKEAFCLIVLAF